MPWPTPCLPRGREGVADKEPLALRTIASVLDQLVHCESLTQLAEIRKWITEGIQPNQRTANLLEACVEQRERELSE